MKKYLDKYSLGVLIPAKTYSERIKNKNTKKFYNHLSLLDIKISQILKLISARNVFVFSDQAGMADLVKPFGVNFFSKSIKNSWPYDFIDYVKLIPKDLIMTCFVTTPFINHQIMADIFLRYISHADYDSIVTVHKIQTHLFDAEKKPYNFHIGSGHINSQAISPVYEMLSGVAVIEKNLAERYRYHIGVKPDLYELSPEIAHDINYQMDWQECRNLLKLNEYKKLIMPNIEITYDEK